MLSVVVLGFLALVTIGPVIALFWAFVGWEAITPLANADILTAFTSGDLDGAWVPEPWATRMVEEAGGHILVDERDLWPEGRFVTTHLMVATEFLDAHPDVVKRLQKRPERDPMIRA